MFTSEGCSLPVGRLCLGIPIELHWTFFLLLVLELITAIFNVGKFSHTMLVLVLYGPFLLFTIVFHELGHAWMNMKYGGSADKIVLWPLGGFVVLGRTDGGVMEDFWVALAGPLTHIPMSAVWFALYCIVASPRSFDFVYSYSELDTVKGWFAAFFESAVYFNLVLFVFNVFVPAYPLDGGRCLAALLVQCGVAVPKAAIITSLTAMVLAGCMIAYGVYSLIVEGLGSILFILIGLLIMYSSNALYRMAQAGQVYAHPLFAKDCYRQAGSAGGNRLDRAAAASGGAAVAAPGAATQVNAAAVSGNVSEADTVQASNENPDTEMGNSSWVNPPPTSSSGGPSWTNTQQQQQQSNDGGSSIADSLRSGMGRMFRKEPKTNAPPDLTI